MIHISGAGICGLSCAIHLLQEGYDVTIHEIRHEIGNPVRSPGIIKDIDIDIISKSLAKQNPHGWAFRREWYEKSLAKKVSDLGGNIRLKSRGPEDSVNCTGGKSQSIGWPISGSQDTGELTMWNGGIVIKTDIPTDFELDTIYDDRFCFERSDGLVECWKRGDLPRPKQGWLELMQGEHPLSSQHIWADEAVDLGTRIAKNIIHSLQEVD